MVLILVQVLCGFFFVSDIIADYRAVNETGTSQFYLSIEALATLSICAAIIFEVKYILELLRRKAHLERSVSVASAAMHDVILAHFKSWDLTPSESDVANFLVKGFGISEIADMRGNAEGTIKSHLNSIYRKSGTRNRGEVLSLILDSLMDGTDT
ncbi:MAG: helix-turn-helix transcriptional regulator [Paracoccaceae bacterium]